MNHLVTLVFLVTALIASFEYSSAADDTEKACKAIVSDLTKRQMGGIAACTKTMTFKNGKDKAAKMNCVLRCVMIKEGVLQADGRMSEATLAGLLDREFSKAPAVLEKVKPIITPCLKAAESIDPDDEFCKSYDPFIKCVLGVIGVMCK